MLMAWELIATVSHDAKRLWAAVVSHPEAVMAERSMICASEKPFRCESGYRFGNEDQNRLLAVEMKLSQQICPRAEMGANRRTHVGREKLIMILLSMMAQQAYACATLWTYGAQVSLAMCRCINSSMDAYLTALEDTHDANGVSATFVSSGERGRSADVIPFPIHKVGVSRLR